MILTLLKLFILKVTAFVARDDNNDVHLQNQMMI
jgi:hypothetical protein